MARQQNLSTEEVQPTTLLLSVFSPFNVHQTPEYHQEEFLSLISTLGLRYDHTMLIKLRTVETNMYLTKGKLLEVNEFCQKHEIERVIVSDILSPVQERNLEQALDVEIWDRERLILEIFKASAHSSEGKIQVEMAEIEYLKTRIIGKGRELAQQAGMIGVRGPGETLKEEIRRHFEEKMRQSKKRLETLERARAAQRKQRVHGSTPQVCIIGYTNAGKSSLLNRLTRSDVLAENKLFATLDTTTRELFLGTTRKLLVSDTVGFIDQLPHNLIAAFRSTLDELRYADLLLQVVDITNPAWKNQLKVVNQTLDQLGVTDIPMLYVFNKIDQLDAEQLAKLKDAVASFQPHVFIHTMSKEAVAPLRDFLAAYPFVKRT